MQCNAMQYNVLTNTLYYNHRTGDLSPSLVSMPNVSGLNGSSKKLLVPGSLIVLLCAAGIEGSA